MTDFTFAIITDTHIRVPGGDLSSPFPVNDKANGRARYAVEVVRAHAPEFTIHLGDVVHPLPHMEAYQIAADEAHRILEPLKPELHFVPGNHDIGDKPSPGMPAKSSNPKSIAVYEKAFGSGWGSFEHKGVLFVFINSSLVNSGLDVEQEQRDWLEATLTAAKDQRVFLFSHYPPFITWPDEQDHYDNYAEPGRSWLLELAARSNVEAIFSGHVHHFFYNRYKGVKLYCLPPTSFTRQDYAEMFPLAPAPEFGRDDAGKFGIMALDVTDQGHRLRFAPTKGCQADADEKVNITPAPPREIALIPHLRHAWFEARSLPYNGPMEEFTRKLVRNDYPLLRLLQLGISSIRTPLSDLLDPAARARMDDWIALGMRFVVFNIGWPSEREYAELSALGDAIQAVEILSTQENIGDLSDGLVQQCERMAQPVWISKITTSAERPDPTKAFAHAVSSGFLPASVPAVMDALQKCTQPDLSVVVQIEWGDDPAKRIPELVSMLKASELTLIPNLRFANSNPAVPNFDDAAIAATFSAAVRATADAGIPLQVDTFEDVDRGYNPRHGFIDRLCNLRELL